MPRREFRQNVEPEWFAHIIPMVCYSSAGAVFTAYALDISKATLMIRIRLTCTTSASSFFLEKSFSGGPLRRERAIITLTVHEWKYSDPHFITLPYEMALPQRDGWRRLSEVSPVSLSLRHHVSVVYTILLRGETLIQAAPTRRRVRALREMAGMNSIPASCTIF